MHLRVNTTRRGDSVYRYAQLVQSVRDEQGRSTTRVVKHLGALPEPVIEALRIGFRAGASGQGVLLTSDVARLLHGQDVANRRYLDLAVLLDCARQWQLARLLDEMAEPSQTNLSLSQVILPLVLQRCCAPGSKLGATRWTPRTAVPELLGFDPQAFNNTRVHRGLEALHQLEGPLQKRLVEAYEKRRPSAVVFMDVTDTYFEGMECGLAEQTRTKTEMPNKRCIGIVLLVNEQGYPMRWAVVGGKTKDWTAMRGMLSDMGEVPWLRQTLIVFDRAMGQRSTVAELKRTGLWFLTAAHRTSIESYTTDLPVAALAKVEIQGTLESYEDDIKHVAEAARKAGFEEVHERLFAVDLGVAIPPGPARYVPRKRWRGQPNKLSQNLRLAEAARLHQRDQPKATQAAIADRLGVSRSRVRKSLALLRLAPAIQDKIHEMGDRFPVPETAIQTLLGLHPDEQLDALGLLLREHQATKDAIKASVGEPRQDDALGPLRMVAYFNPQLFVDARLRAQEHCALLERRVAQFNEELANAKQSRKRDPTFRRFSREVERLNYLDTFDIHLEPITVTSPKGTPLASFRGSLTRKPDAWARRRKYDGFVLLLGHPDLTHSATELVQHYRGKDVVEKDFQTIKSLVKLRPIFSYTDPKVLAHITICMLALLLLRTLTTRLANTQAPVSAQAAIEILEDCRLNQRDTDAGTPVYHLTRLNQEQEEILSRLNLAQLADQGHVSAAITPRS